MPHKKGKKKMRGGSKMKKKGYMKGGKMHYLPSKKNTKDLQTPRTK